MRKAIFTVCKDDEGFLAIWSRYYSDEFDEHDIYVFDHLTKDGSVARLKQHYAFRYATLTHPVYGDFWWYRRAVQNIHRKLLLDYDLVVFAEPDEIIYHPKGLANYLDSLPTDYATCTGYEIVQQKQEPKLDPSDRVLAQRHFWRRDPMYDKTLVSKIPLNWGFGFHRTTRQPLRDGTLLLIHLHKIDYVMAIAKNKKYQNLLWYIPNGKYDSKWSIQHKLTERAFDKYFYDGDRPWEDAKTEVYAIEPIPEVILATKRF
jgi:hypothetical protein